MWDLPGPGLEPVSLVLAGRFLTTEPPGKPLVFSFEIRDDTSTFLVEWRHLCLSSTQQRAWTKVKHKHRPLSSSLCHLPAASAAGIWGHLLFCRSSFLSLVAWSLWKFFLYGAAIDLFLPLVLALSSGMTQRSGHSLFWKTVFHILKAVIIFLWIVFSKYNSCFPSWLLRWMVLRSLVFDLSKTLVRTDCSPHPATCPFGI